MTAKLNPETAASCLRVALATIPPAATEAERIELALRHSSDLLTLLLKQHPSSTAVSIYIEAMRTGETK